MSEPIKSLDKTCVCAVCHARVAGPFTYGGSAVNKDGQVIVYCEKHIPTAPQSNE